MPDATSLGFFLVGYSLGNTPRSFSGATFMLGNFVGPWQEMEREAGLGVMLFPVVCPALLKRRQPQPPTRDARRALGSGGAPWPCGCPLGRAPCGRGGATCRGPRFAATCRGNAVRGRWVVRHACATHRSGAPFQNARGTWKVAARRRRGGLCATRGREGVAPDRGKGTSVR